MVNKNYNIFDYLDWRGDLSFQQDTFNEVDALILSIMSYLDFSCLQDTEIHQFKDSVMQINQLSDEVKYNGPSIIMHSVVEMANRAAGTKRFHEIGVSRFIRITDEEREIQFAAITFFLPDQTVFVSFRGTDNTLVGWKEDFNMSFIDGVPAQIEATKYVEQTAQQFDMPLRLGGHSKGGNLAIWASANLPTKYRERVLKIYSNDGPGFSENFLSSSIYLNVREKILSFVPESSIVGVLMEHDNYITIRSSNPTVLQHDPFSWLIFGSHFVYDETRSISGRQFERIINSWIRSMSAKEREEMIDNIYEILISLNAKTIDDLDKNKIRSMFLMQKTFREMGLKKQTQLIVSLGKVIFNSDILVNGNLLTLLKENPT